MALAPMRSASRLPVTICHCQKKSVSTSNHLLRRRFFTPPASPAVRLNGSIEAYLRSGNKRNFSHVLRGNRLRRPSASAPRPASLAAKPVHSRSDGLQIAHLIAPASIRSYSSSYRSHHVQLYTRIASALALDFLHPAIAEDAKRAEIDAGSQRRSGAASSSARSVVATRGFSHKLRERKADLLRAFLPTMTVRAASTAAVGAQDVACSAHGTSATGRTAKKMSWLLRGILAGGTIYAALQFAMVQQAVEQATVLNDKVYVPFDVTAVQQVSPTTSIVTLKGEFRALQPIASISVKEPGSNVQRPYTVLDIDDAQQLRVLVKRYDDGVLSRYITGRKPGQRLWIRSAEPAYAVPDDKAQLPKQYLMIVAGTGVATAYQLARHLQHIGTLTGSSNVDSKSTVQNGGDSATRVDVLYSSRSRDEVYLSTELEAAASSVRYFVDSEGTAVDLAAIKSALRTANANSDTQPQIQTQVLVCGPDGFVDHVAGYKPEQGQGVVGGLCAKLGLTSVWKL